ncbi:serine hydrolase [Geomicrobium sp. JCM 19039]|uniref:serine hydrolase domain-containing protein n=1 Tax=Geomicrobium sp. JCM 19039 TaxID=1460636 RepID=UPI0005A96F17|nr:serine hydrolase [Geomicrobium sp. JCM 19039]
MKYAGYTRSEMVKDLLEQPVHVEPGVKRVYSDLGMMLLYFLCEKILNNEFESYFYERVTQPLGMDCTSFNPKTKKNIAATEYDERHGTHKRGIVHDEKAEQMGGISGHAGLFSTAKDLQKYLAIYETPRNEIISKSLIETSFTGLGWQMSGQTFSHTGFTGVNMWCDPVEKLRVVFLTNRVHFGRSYNLTFLREQIKEAIYKKIGGG